MPSCLGFMQLVLLILLYQTSEWNVDCLGPDIQLCRAAPCGRSNVLEAFWEDSWQLFHPTYVHPALKICGCRRARSSCRVPCQGQQCCWQRGLCYFAGQICNQRFGGQRTLLQFASGINRLLLHSMLHLSESWNNELQLWSHPVLYDILLMVIIQKSTDT